MTHTGRVKTVDPSTVPNTGKAARRVLVARPDDTWREFWVPLNGPAPVAGQDVEYGPHHVWWAGIKIDKTYDRDPNAPLAGPVKLRISRIVL